MSQLLRRLELRFAFGHNLLERWLQSIQPYVHSDRVRWMTLPQMYDEYILWEQEH